MSRVALFIDEHAAFPDGKYDDQVDTTTGAVDFLKKNRGDERRSRSRLSAWDRSYARMTA